jgi:hypothetical protein
MNVELITSEDLKKFKIELLNDIKQNLRINGILRFTKMGSIMYYKLEDINKVLEENGR